jgi:hypothetical protein
MMADYLAVAQRQARWLRDHQDIVTAATMDLLIERCKRMEKTLWVISRCRLQACAGCKAAAERALSIEPTENIEPEHNTERR